MAIRILCLLLGVVCATLVNAEIYKTVDKDGRVIYTDKPGANQPAEPVNLPPINTIPPETPVNNSPAPEQSEAANTGYQVHIISPRENVTIPPGERDLAIAVTLNRNLEGDHWLVYFMNGELLEETQESSIVIQDVTRGSHTLIVEVIDSRGVTLGKSEPVVVNVIRPGIKPASPPKPKG